MVKNTRQKTGLPAYRDFDAIYFADSCEPLRRAAGKGEVKLEALARDHYPGASLPDSDLEGVMTLGYWDSVQQQDWALDWHRNEGIEITYLARGSLGFSLDEQDWTLMPGDITITRPWQRHRVGNPVVGPSHLHWLILDVGVRHPNQNWRWPDWIALSAGDLNALTRLLQFNEQTVWPGSKEIAETFAELARCIDDHHRNTLQSRLRVLLSRLLLEVLEMLERQDICLDEELASAKRSVQVFLDELAHHLDRRWTLGELAERCGLGRTRFSAYCRELTNMSPIEYLTELRMREAACLLRDRPDVSITDIAFRCGFESSQYFSASFRKHFRVSPRTYRNGAPRRRAAVA